MDLAVLALMTLVVMYATLRSPILGVSGSLSVALVGTLGGAAPVHWLPPVAGGFLMGLAAASRLRPAVVVTGAGVPVGLLMAALIAAEDRAALRAELLEILTGGRGAIEWPAGAPDPDALVDIALTLMPAFNAMLVVAVMALCYGVAARVFPRLGVPLRRPAPLASWRLPFAVIWTLVAGLVLVVIGWGLDAPLPRTIGANLCVVHGGAFFVEGVAVIRYALEARGVPGRWQLLGAAIVVPLMIAVPLQVIVAGLGMLDMWFDFRKLELDDTGSAASGGPAA
ncbi:MAG: DUF2232 domain-containing protein [Candidatus Eiseniibacteriota bacterium]|jgi:hypothetical protein